MDERVHRRRRVRHTGPADRGVDQQSGEPDVDAVIATFEIGPGPPGWAGDADQTDGVERGLRGLVGGGSSQISPTAALRARDAARPRREDLARADADLTIVRRYWVPRDS